MKLETVYRLISERKPIARFGFLRTSKGEYGMPALAPSLGTEKDAIAFFRNLQKGQMPSVLSLKASCGSKTVPTLHGLIFPKRDKRVEFQRPLILPDPESEALSVSCNARLRFKEQGVPASMKNLLSCGLTSDGKRRKQVHVAWSDMVFEYDLGVLRNWLVEKFSAIGSDFFFSTPPIMRTDMRTIRKSFSWGYTILDDALSEPTFPLNGLHLLLHNELFKSGEEAEYCRKEILDEIGSWSSDKEEYRGLVLSVKFYDQNEQFTSQEQGQIHRMNISEFVQSLAQNVRSADGLLAIHSMGNWGIGMLDSGADISTFNASGRMRWIDTIVKRASGRKGKKPPPDIFDVGTLVDMNHQDARKEYKKSGGFPICSSMSSSKYWNLGTWSEKKIYSIRTRVGGMLDLNEEYRKAGLDEQQPFGEHLMNRIRSSCISQELRDLCPSAAFPIVNADLNEWTAWRKVADSRNWYDNKLEYAGPSCYELGIGVSGGVSIQPVYVGETGDEKARISEYASSGSHLSDRVDAHLRKGFTLHYRGLPMDSKEEAKKMQDNLLMSRDYPWNVQLNVDEEDGAV